MNSSVSDVCGQTRDRREIAVVQQTAPFDLPLSLRAAASFFPASGPPPTALRTPVDGGVAVVEIRQASRSGSLLHASAAPTFEPARLRRIAKWLVSSDLDLRPFYRLVAAHTVMAPIVASLRGLKPLRPATLFEMAIVAITEQQLSLAAAYHIRGRLIRRLGSQIEDLWAFPAPASLAAAALEDLMACGLSRRKAEYVKELASRVMQGALDLESLKRQDEPSIREILLSIRGLGEWSALYILSRGLGRPDCLPATDVGLRRVIGNYFGQGRPLSSAQLEIALLPFRPFRGLAAYYLAVHWRLRGALLRKM